MKCIKFFGKERIALCKRDGKEAIIKKDIYKGAGFDKKWIERQLNPSIVNDR